MVAYLFGVAVAEDETHTRVKQQITDMYIDINVFAQFSKFFINGVSRLIRNLLLSMFCHVRFMIKLNTGIPSKDGGPANSYFWVDDDDKCSYENMYSFSYDFR